MELKIHFIEDICLNLLGANRWRHVTLTQVHLDKMSIHAHGLPYEGQQCSYLLITQMTGQDSFCLLAPAARTIDYLNM